MLAERLALERQEIQVRKKAQEKVSNALHKTVLLIAVTYPALQKKKKNNTIGPAWLIHEQCC